MSNRPGIGAAAVPEIASTLLQYNLDTSQPDVPTCLAHGKRRLPLGRYLRRKLRQQIGKEPNAPTEIREALQLPVQQLYEATKSAHQASPGGLPLDYKFREALLKENEGSLINLRAKHKIFSQKRDRL